MSLDLEVCLQLEEFYVALQLNDAAHRTVISYLYFEPPRPAIEAASRSRSWAKLTCKSVLPTADYQAAISDMIARDLVWEIEAGQLAQIAEYLAASPALGPMDGLPELHTLQYSVRFANLLDEFWAAAATERPGVLWSRDWHSDKRHLIYSPTRDGCFEFLRDELARDEEATQEASIIDVEWLQGPNPCGPWRCHWWHRFESGFVLDVRYR